MRKASAIITVVVAIFTTATAATNEEILKQRLDSAIKEGDWATAEVVSKTLANMATVASQRQQEEFFKQNNEFMTGVMNLYRATPQILSVIRRVASPKEGTEEHLLLNVIAPELFNTINTGNANQERMIKELKKFQDANKRRW